MGVAIADVSTSSPNSELTRTAVQRTLRKRSGEELRSTANSVIAALKRM